MYVNYIVLYSTCILTDVPYRVEYSTKESSINVRHYENLRDVTLSEAMNGTGNGEWGPPVYPGK